MPSPSVGPDWPKCEKCGGVIWKVRRESRDSGFETQFFTCLDCDHVTERTVLVSAEDAARLRKSA
jgi:hypothetical protein